VFLPLQCRYIFTLSILSTLFFFQPGYISINLFSFQDFIVLSSVSLNSPATISCNNYIPHKVTEVSAILTQDQLDEGYSQFLTLPTSTTTNAQADRVVMRSISRKNTFQIIFRLAASPK
jgi:hypothetical protein